MNISVTSVSPISALEIEKRASDLLKEFDPEALTTPTKVNLDKFVGVFLAKKGVGLILDEDFNNDCEGYFSSDGSFVFHPDYWERMRNGHARARFTVAHEIGHWCLHFSQLIEAAYRPQLRVARFQQDPKKAYLSPEWQADHFAGSFLMPACAMQAAIEQAKLLYRTSFHITGQIARSFGVSNQAVETRISKLKKLGVF